MSATGSQAESKDVTLADSAYIFREIIANVPLSEDEEQQEDVYITCVEYWDGNLYIGTSAGGLLHYVSLPPEDPDSPEEQPTFILASRLEPPFTTKGDSSLHLPGVEQILLLPAVDKACILCNGTLTFYSLPEFSPAYGGIKQGDCTWMGGLDRNHVVREEKAEETTIVICLRQKLRVIRLGKQARKTRDIDLRGCISIERRDDLACVADGKSYSLLDVVEQRKIDLFPISSQVEGSDAIDTSAEEQRPSLTRLPSRSFSSRSPVRRLENPGHERISSLGAEPRNMDRLRPDSPSAWPARRSSRESPSASPAGTPTRNKSPVPDLDDKPLPSSPLARQFPVPAADQVARPLLPHIVTPTSTEFLLTTGTSLGEPGVGMFVNLDGDVVRGTIEFSTYPESLVVIGGEEDAMAGGDSQGPGGDGYVLSIVKPVGSPIRHLEVQRWDVDPGEQHASKRTIPLPQFQAQAEGDKERCVRLRRPVSGTLMPVSAVTQALSLRRISLHEPLDEEKTADEKRAKDEDRLLARFANVSVSVLLYADSTIWWVARNPELVQLDHGLNQGLSLAEDESLPKVVRSKVEQVYNSIRGQDAKDELDFLTLNYIRQKAALLLLIDLVVKTYEGTHASEHDKRFTQDALISSDIEPRLVLSIIPGLRYESIEGPSGIWTARGLQTLVSTFKDNPLIANIPRDPSGPYGTNILHILKPYLTSWRRKKGFGSVSDETQVFATVDAALLHVLLLLDASSPSGPAAPGSVRAELNDLLDHGVDNFDRAIALLEQFQRLYLLSRLYQSRKLVAQVLATWRRVLSGEEDKGGELVDGEMDVRKYLTRIKDSGLVKEYGTWLASRNPKLGVQVFADDHARVKFEPAEAVKLLEEKAGPAAVKEYLEHLVFGKGMVGYVNELISFYLDTVVDEISREDDGAAREVLKNTYETYRALKPPKPTYRQFITDNAVEEDWYRNRLRLLQLIGGSHDAASRYDVDKLAERLEPYSELLVPEMIILNGRRGRHVEALRLLSHGLGDYDTAIRYCLRGGSSIFHPDSGAGGREMPSQDEQKKLFGCLLSEFMKIEDEDERRDRSAELLERFGGWFDIEDVLAMMPDDWSLECLSGFIVQALRTLVRERNESVILRALSAAQNLRFSNEVVEKIEGMKPVIQSKDDAPGQSMDSGYKSMASSEGDLDSIAR